MQNQSENKKMSQWLSFTVVLWVLSFFSTDIKVKLNVLYQRFLLAVKVQQSSAGHSVSSLRHAYIMVNHSLCWISMWNGLLSALHVTEKCEHGKLWCILSVKEDSCLLGDFFFIIVWNSGMDIYSLVLRFTATEINC